MASEGLGKAAFVEHVIETTGHPIKQRCRLTSLTLRKHDDKELIEMLRSGAIEKLNRSWSSPIEIVPQKGVTYRFCVDYRKPINQVTNILDRLRDAKYLTFLDIKSAYWQIPVTESSRPYTAFFILGRGLYQFRRMPFGLHNTPASWQRLIHKILSPKLEPYVFAYIDV